MPSWIDVLDRGDEATSPPVAVSGAVAAIGTSGGKYALEDHRHAFDPSTDLSMASHKLTNLAAPTSAGDAVTKSYADALGGGVTPKAAVRVATAAALPAYARVTNTITASGNGALTVDGVALDNGDRVLLKDGAAGADNGLYVVTDKGGAGTPFILDRASDADTSAEVKAGLFTFVEEGTANADLQFVLTTNNPITLNTTSLTFSQYGAAGAYVGGNGLALTGLTFSVNVDGSSIEISSDTLQVKALGVTNAMLAGSIALAKLATDPLARANHTGTQTASTISDFDTQVRTSRADQIAAPQGVVDFSNGSAFLKLPKMFAYANAAALPAAAANGQLAFQTDTGRLRVSR